VPLRLYSAIREKSKGSIALDSRGRNWLLYAIHAIYYGLAYGTAKAMVADIVPTNLRGTAYGTYNAVLAILDFPALLIAGILWQGVGSWPGFSASAPFLFGSVPSSVAAVWIVSAVSRYSV